MPHPLIDVVFCIDTTGSMAPCIGQVRRNLEGSLINLSRETPGIRIGIQANGDYCDEHSTYLLKEHPLSTDIGSLVDFVRNVGPTGGGDLPEAYEFAFHKARSLGWGADRAKVYVPIADDVAHEVSYPMNRLRLDWRNELRLLADMGVVISPVQALNQRRAEPFWKEVASIGRGVYLRLAQFHEVNDLIWAICMQQAGSDRLASFERELVDAGRMSRTQGMNFDSLSGRSVPTERYRTPDAKLVPVEPGRFQVMHVDDDVAIREFVRANALRFRTGSGYYEFAKAETVQPHKEIVLMDTRSGDMWTGDAARHMLGLADREKGVRDTSKNVTLHPSSVPHGFTAFIQSTSVNRKLKGGTKFLYRVLEDDTVTKDVVM